MSRKSFRLGTRSCSEVSIEKLLSILHKIIKPTSTAAPQNRKLVFMYLANDVIQNSKKKGPEYQEHFTTILAKAFTHIGKSCSDEKTLNSLNRILTIWEERGVYEADKVKGFRAGIAGKVPTESAAKSSKSAPSSSSSSGSKKRKHEDQSAAPTSSNGDKKKPTPSAKVVEVNGETHVTLSPHLPVGDPPEPEELVQMMQDLEDAASSDATTREKITRLPPEVSSLETLNKIDDKEAALKLSKKVNDAVELLNSYNARLNNEMSERNKLSVMLKDFQREQQELLTQAEQKLQVILKFLLQKLDNNIKLFQEYTEKLKKVREVQKEIKNRMENLPDITNLPDVTGGLAALPSAADLFVTHR